MPTVGVPSALCPSLWRPANRTARTVNGIYSLEKIGGGVRRGYPFEENLLEISTNFFRKLIFFQIFTIDWPNLTKGVSFLGLLRTRVGGDKNFLKIFLHLSPLLYLSFISEQ